MTRKDYILIAEALRVQYLGSIRDIKQAEAELTPFEAAHEGKQTLARCDGQKLGIYAVALEIADSLKRDNPRFDREHFLAVVRGDKELNSRPGSR